LGRWFPAWNAGVGPGLLGVETLRTSNPTRLLWLLIRHVDVVASSFMVGVIRVCVRAHERCRPFHILLMGVHCGSALTWCRRGVRTSIVAPGEAATRDEILDNIMFTWVTNARVFSGRLYWETSSATPRWPGPRQPADLDTSTRRARRRGTPNQGGEQLG
jgi:hypothetical protein